jgi:hypothetical protein
MLEREQKIDGYVRDLLYDHDCVIVMDLGGFIAHYHPASINESLRFITPPSKRIAFNTALRNNDGLLAHHISFQESLTYSEACALVKEYASNIRSVMERGGKYKLDKVGVLFMDHAGNTQFLPDTSTNFLADSFGLPIVQAVPIYQETAASGTESIHEPVVIEFQPRKEEEQSGAKVRKLRVMEMIPAAAIIALLIMSPPIIQRFNTHMGSLVPFSRIDEIVAGEEVVYKPLQVNPAQTPEKPTENQPVSDTEALPITDTVISVIPEVVESTEDETLSGPEQVSIPETNIKTEVEEQPKEKIRTKSEKEETRNARTYHVIVGSYRNRHNAKRMVRELRKEGIDAEMINRGDDRILVTVFSAKTEQEAEQQLPLYRSKVISSAWVFESFAKD